MLTLGANTRVFVALDPVDMRGSFDALAGHVRRLPADPLDGHVYIFVNRRRRLLKALWFDRTVSSHWGAQPGRYWPGKRGLMSPASTAIRQLSGVSSWIHFDGWSGSRLRTS